MPLNLVLKFPICLIDASFKLSLNEFRLLILIFLKYGELKHIDIELTAEDLTNYLNVPLSQAYRFLEKCSKTFNEKYFQLFKEDNSASLERKWLSKITYQKGKAYAAITLSQELASILNDRTGKFLFFDCNEALKLNTYYAIRLYLLSLHLQADRNKTISIEKLRHMFCLNDSYARFTNLNTRVIQPSIDDINEHPPLLITIAFEKAGPKITFLRFKIKEKIKRPTQIKRCPQTMEMFD